jgi:hypothetical protein
MMLEEEVSAELFPPMEAARQALVPVPRAALASVPPRPWRLTPLDGILALGVLAGTLAVCVPLGLHLRSEAAALERERSESSQRSRALHQTLQRLETRQEALGRLQRAVSRYMINVEMRPVVPWPSVLTELERCRPGGVRLTRVIARGPQLEARIDATRPDLAEAYVDRLQESQLVRVVTLASSRRGDRIIGQLSGD